MERQLTAKLDFRNNRRNGAGRSLRLGELLLATGCLSREQLDESLRKQSLSHKKLGKLLVDEGYVRPGFCVR